MKFNSDNDNEVFIRYNISVLTMMCNYTMTIMVIVLNANETTYIAATLYLASINLNTIIIIDYDILLLSDLGEAFVHKRRMIYI